MRDNRRGASMQPRFMTGHRPDATASLKGAPAYPNLTGNVFFYQTARGVYVEADVKGLPVNPNSCRQPIFAFHIHAGDLCSGNADDPFGDAGPHYNPDRCEHPYHAGDLPPLLSANGRAWCAVLTDRFTVREVLGRAVIIHAGIDDFMTQPSGNAGMKIACGIIRK